MRAHLSLLTIAGISLTMTTPALAQDGRAGVTVVPAVGWFAPGPRLGSVVEEGTSSTLQQGSSVMLSLTAELPLTERWLSARGSLGYAPGSSVAVRRAVPAESCGPNCFRTAHEDVRLADSRVLLMSAGLVATLPALLVTQPYLFGGGGVKRHSVAHDQLPSEFGDVFAREQSDFAMHVGVGAEVAAGRGIVLRAELSDHLSRYRLANTGQESPHGTLQHDIGVQLGLRLRR
jgi:hypothetical protein